MAKTSLEQRLYNSLQRKLARMIEDEQDEIVRTYAIALRKANGLIKRFFSDLERDSESLPNPRARASRLRAIQNDLSELLEEAGKDVEDLLHKGTAEIFRQSVLRQEYIIDQVGGMGLSWGLIPEEAVKAAVESSFAKMSVSDTVRAAGEKAAQEIKRRIVQTVATGEGYDKVSRNLAHFLGVSISENGKSATYTSSGLAAKARQIARTEGQRVIVEGQMRAGDQAMQLGCEIERVWDATLDGKTRPLHGALDGQVRDEEKGGWHVPGIGIVPAPLQSGVASFDINCRCRVRDQIKGLPPKQRYVRGDGIRPYMTYAQWKKHVLDKADIHIGRSVGAAAKNYPVRLPGGGKAKLSEGTSITDIKVIAGRGHKTPIRDRFMLESNYHIKADKWQKLTGNGFVEEHGKVRPAEIHWYEADGERVLMKVKRYKDES